MTKVFYLRGDHMNDNFQHATIQAVQDLYETNTDAKKLFDWTASLQKDASETSLERLMNVLNISRKAAVSLAQELEKAGCGTFIVGRKGARSRFQWSFSRISLGQVAAGETEEIEPVSTDLTTEAEEEATLTDAKPLNIASAKALLASSLGVSPEQIEITVKG
jgi:hypothetical protein